jgi:hypothetical protein
MVRMSSVGIMMDRQALETTSCRLSSGNGAAMMTVGSQRS